MASIVTQPSIINIKQVGYIFGGFLLVVLSLVSEPYLHKLSPYLIVAGISFGLFTVEGTLLKVIYSTLISKKSRVKEWSKKNRFLAFIIVIFAFIWTLMLFEISKGVYYSVFAHKI